MSSIKKQEEQSLPEVEFREGEVQEQELVDANESHIHEWTLE